MNITCSNRCANPVRPGRSSPDPTWYHVLTATTGVEWSSWRITSRPLGSVYFSNRTAGTSPAAPGARWAAWALWARRAGWADAGRARSDPSAARTSTDLLIGFLHEVHERH